jgi:hypothetical protein
MNLLIIVYYEAPDEMCRGLPRECYANSVIWQARFCPLHNGCFASLILDVRHVRSCFGSFQTQSVPSLPYWRLSVGPLAVAEQRFFRNARLCRILITLVRKIV